MYCKLDEKELEMIEKVRKITCTDYGLVGDFMPVDSFISAIDELLYEINYLEEKIEDLEKEKVFGKN